MHTGRVSAPLYERIADLPLAIEGYRVEPLSSITGARWTRRTTVVVLSGGGHEGRGEDVIYEEPDQLAFQRDPCRLPLGGEHRFEPFARRLDGLDLFSRPPVDESSRPYRRWAFESAALDLALRQNGLSLARALGRDLRPVRFVASLGLGQPPTLGPLERLLRVNPELEFKVDYDRSWTPELIERLAALERVRVVDLKGQYRGSFRGPASDAARYRQVADGLPEVWIEDPDWSPEIAAALAPHLERVSWDAPIHSLADVERLPFAPRALNMKPSRFGRLSELLRTYEHCERRGIATYGGGQFELGPGRGQAQYLAGLFHPAAPNDLAPAVYNRSDAPADLPRSPLRLSVDAAGFRVR